jgi:hypothetical protein
MIVRYRVLPGGYPITIRRVGMLEVQDLANPKQAQCVLDKLMAD